MGIGVIIPVLTLISRRMRDTDMKMTSVFAFLILFVVVKISDIFLQFMGNDSVGFVLFILTFFFLVSFFVFSLLPTNYFYGQDEPALRTEANLQGWSVSKQGKVSKIN
jgi:uncharacterized membrane protein YhaH (DUF805 family)